MSTSFEQVRDRFVKAQATVDRVTDLAERWENATELSSGQPSIVARAFAAELRKAISGD